jgi:hypothetical protein
MMALNQYFERQGADRMKHLMKQYIKTVDALILEGRPPENGAEKPAISTNGSPAGQKLDYNRIIEIHLTKISFYQHERLVPYLFHYYTLENGVQKMVRQYDALMEISGKSAPKQL